MLVGRGQRHPAPGGTRQEAFADQEGLVDVLQGPGLLPHRGRHGLQAHRPAAEAVEDGREDAPVHGVEPAPVDLQARERQLHDAAVEPAVSLHLGEVAGPLQEPDGDARRAAGPARQFLGAGLGAQTMEMRLERFTLVGATTRTGLLTSPLRARFGIVHRLDFYTPADIEHIVKRSARILAVELSPDAAAEIGRRSRGTPRIANRLLRRVRDYAQVKADGRITRDLARKAMDLLEVDEHGFDEVDRRLLTTIIEKFGGGPVGLKSLSAALSEEPDALEDIHEPFLIQLGFLERTKNGRVATPRAYEFFGKPMPGRELF